MKQLVLTIIGPDKTGLVESVSNVIVTNKGHWLASDLGHLCGFFAGIIQVELPEENLTTFSEQIAELNIVKIHEDGDFEQNRQAQQINFVITGNDRPGIVNELATVISHKGANIVHFTSNQQSAPNWGVPLFHAVATVELPAHLDKDAVVDALESLATDLIVDVEQ